MNIITFPLKANHLQAGYSYTLFAPITLMYGLCLGILKVYLHRTNELYRSGLSKVIAIQTDATKNITILHLQVIILY